MLNNGLYINNIKDIYKSEHIKNYKIYDNVNEERDIIKYKQQLELTYAGSDIEYISESESESESENDESVGVIEEKVERPNAKIPKAKTQKAAIKGREMAAARKFVAFLMWYEFLKGNENIDKNMSMDDFKKIPIVQKWIKIAEEEVEIMDKKLKKKVKKTRVGVTSGLNSINKFGLSDDWEKSKFKDYKLYGDEKMSSWEENFNKKYPQVINAGKMNKNYIKGPDKFFRHVLSKSKIKTLDELLEHFKDTAIYTKEGKKQLDKLTNE